jgi:putative SOS response-associated peptidase YedK
MCGRFTVTSPDDLVDEFDLPGLPSDLSLAPRFNVAPTQPVPVLANRAERRLELYRWGLVPRWAKDPSIGNKLINARAESLAERPAFRDAFARRRCLVLADGFYEWRREGKAKIPYYIRRRDRRPIGFAGLWERWKAPDGSSVPSCTIVTCDANELVAPLHDRMPTMVPRVDRDRWLSPETLPPEALADILRPPPAADLELYRVDTAVNSPANDGPECIAPATGGQLELL